MGSRGFLGKLMGLISTKREREREREFTRTEPACAHLQEIELYTGRGGYTINEQES